MADLRGAAVRSMPALSAAIFVMAAGIGAFVGGLWAALGIGLGLLLFLGVWLRDGKPSWPPKRLTLFAVAVLAVFATELPLSLQPALSVHMWLQLASIFLPLLLLTSPRLQGAASSPFLMPVAAAAAAIGAVLLGLELLSGGVVLHSVKHPDSSLTEYNRGIAHLAIFAFPLSAGLWLAGRQRAAACLAVLLLFPAGLTESHTAKLALIAGILCAAAAFYRPVWVARALGAAAAVVMGWPFYAQRLYAADHAAIAQWHGSWLHRMEIWDYLSYRIMERPVFGWGLGTTHLLDFTQPHGDWYKIATMAAPHAHNFVTELWVETGLVGLAFGLAFLFWTLRAAVRLHPALRPFALGGWAAALCVAMFGFDFWTDALWGAFALSAFAFGVVEKRIESGDDVADIQLV